MRTWPLLALVLAACSPAIGAGEAGPDGAADASTCDPTTCDRDCLAAGQGGGACRAAGCVCLGVLDASMGGETGPESSMVDVPLEVSPDASAPDASPCDGNYHAV